MAAIGLLLAAVAMFFALTSTSYNGWWLIGLIIAGVAFTLLALSLRGRTSK